VVTVGDAAILIGGGLAAGVMNTLAGGGSLLTVPLLVLVGLPGNVANGTNRIGVLLQSATAAWRFRALGVSGIEGALPVIVPVCAGSLVGAFLIARVAGPTFEKLFGLVMLAVLIPTLRPPRVREEAASWPRWLTFLVFFAIGLYGGAFQAGIGLLIVAALAHAGLGLVAANSIKNVVNFVQTVFAIPAFLLAGQVRWPEAIALAAGFSAGGALGARLAVRGGERVIRPVMALAVMALAGRMLGLY
jgi:uncharacterized membrane protein YfcA